MTKCKTPASTAGKDLRKATSSAETKRRHAKTLSTAPRKAKTPKK